MQPIGSILKKQAHKYLVSDNDTSIKADIELDLPFEQIIDAQKRFPQLTFAECEYMLLGERFYTKLLDYNGFLLHSSAVAYKDNAYLFSAPSGTGKSTHVSIWLKVFEGCECINDDKPALRFIDGVFYACGTPFSGKTDTSCNKCVPLKGICVLSRNEHNSIEPMPASMGVYHILNQTIRPKQQSSMNSLLNLIDLLSKNVSIYSLKCNMQDEAAYVSYKGMQKED